MYKIISTARFKKDLKLALILCLSRTGSHADLFR